MKLHTAIDTFEELIHFFQTKKELLHGKEVRIKVMADSNIVANEEGFFVNPEKLNLPFIKNNEINLHLFKTPQTQEIPQNIKAYFNVTKQLWQQMRPKFIISYS